MSYAIIRNEKYTLGQLNVIYRHNERKNTNYSNTDIERENSKDNYSIKQCPTTYEKAFRNIKSKYDLKGKIKNISNVACEYIITASPEFFVGLSKQEIKRYFESAYRFVCGFKNLGEQYILSAKVHLDESTPHLHLVYLPVVHTVDKKSGKNIEKLCCTDFWRGKNSYKYLQDNFYNYITKSGFELERGDIKENKHIRIEDLKKVTNYEMQKYEKEMINLEPELDIENTEELKREYKRIIKKFNTLAKQYTRVKTMTDNVIQKQIVLEEENNVIIQENERLEKANSYLHDFIDKTFEYVSILFNFPKDRLKRLVKDFVDKMKGV